MNTISVSTLSRACLVLSLSFSAASFAKGELKLSNSVFHEVDVSAVNGDVQTQRVPVAKVFPGTEVVYVVTYENLGDKPAVQVTITNPVPSAMSYVAGSAAGENAEVSVSVDGGELYSDLSALAVQSDNGELRPAVAGDVTNVRWQISVPVLPGTVGTVEYRARLK